MLLLSTKCTNDDISAPGSVLRVGMDFMNSNDMIKDLSCVYVLYAPTIALAVAFGGANKKTSQIVLLS